MEGCEGVKVEGFIVVAVICHIGCILPPALVRAKPLLPATAVTLYLGSRPVCLTSTPPSPPWPISAFKVVSIWLGPSGSDANLTPVNPFGAWQTCNSSLTPPHSAYAHRWCTPSSWTSSPWSFVQTRCWIPAGSCWKKALCPRWCCCCWWRCCRLAYEHISASGCPWRAAGRWGQRHWGRTRWGSWRPTAFSLTGSVRQRWSSNLKKKGAQGREGDITQWSLAANYSHELV